MEIDRANTSIRNKPVLVRLTTDVYDWLTELSGKAGGGVATTIRSILESAKREGVEIVGDEDPNAPHPESPQEQPQAPG